MEYALDKSTEDLVHAAHAKRWVQYKCRRCGADCHLSHKSRPYFAHNPGQGSPDCEDYFPGSGYVTTGSERERSLPYRTLNLYVHCPDISTSEPNWNLFLLIPEAPSGPGIIRIASGYRGTVNLPLTMIPSGGRRVHIVPQATPYKLDADGVIDLTYRSRFDKPAPGLRKAGCSVFRYSANGGRRLSDNAPLYWGRAYFVVWPEGFAPGWWPVRLLRKGLRPQPGWRCAMIELPTEEDPQTAAWVERELQRQVLQPPALISVVSPAGNWQLDDESVVIPAGSDIIIGVFGESGAVVPQELEWIGPGQRVPQRIPLPNSLPAFVCLTRPDHGRVDVWLSDESEAALSLVVTEQPKAPLPTGVVLRIKDAEKSIHSVPLFSKAAGNMLRDVQQKRLTLTGVTLPARVYGTIRTKKPNDAAWSEHVVMPQFNNADGLQEPHSEFESRMAATVIAHLSQKNKLVQIDFENYGATTIEPVQQALQPASTLSLTPQQRQRVRWMLSVSGTGGTPSNQVAVLASLADQFSADEDCLLLRRLAQRSLWPTHLESHLRSLISTIVAEIKH